MKTILILMAAMFVAACSDPKESYSDVAQRSIAMEQKKYYRGLTCSAIATAYARRDVSKCLADRAKMIEEYDARVKSIKSKLNIKEVAFVLIPPSPIYTSCTDVDEQLFTNMKDVCERSY